MEAASEAAPARVIGRYALYDRIAAGGMATVHLGRLLGPVGFARTVAIKRLHPQFAEDPEFVTMFLDEARVAARVRHPNVVPTIDVVAIESELFLVMEYVQGESLSRLMHVASSQQQPIAPGMVATLMTGVLHGLHAAHEARDERGEPLGIVHRDVSPQNILVGVDGVPRVLDFGVAKAAGRLQSTRTGQLKGKLAYMAPEQIGGAVARTTDVYAASVVMWEALTGKRLFRGENEGEVMKLVLEANVPPLRQVAPEVPPALEAITMRGLDADPAKRFQTAGEMAFALEDALPLVPASRIGQWVQSAAGDALGRRSLRVAAIESDSALSKPSLKQTGTPAEEPVSTTRAVPSKPAVDGTQIVSDDMILPTQLSSGSVSVASGGTPAAKPAWRAWAIGGAAVGTLVGAMAVVAVVAGRHDETPAAPASSPAPAAKPVESPRSASPPSIAVEDLPTASSSAEPPSSATATATATATPTAIRAAPAARPAPTKASCDPPYYFDKDGTRVFKKECL